MKKLFYILIAFCLSASILFSQEYRLELPCIPSDAGTTTGTGNYKVGIPVTISAKANPKYHFTKWTDIENKTLSTNSSYTINLTSDSVICAIFAPDTFSVKVEQNIAEGGKVSGSGKAAYKSSAIITATPFECYHFVRWEDVSGKTISTNADEAIQILSDTTLKAIFEQDSFSVSVISVPKSMPQPLLAMGKIIGTGKYACGDSATITAISEGCYRFVYWKTANGTIVSEQPTISMLVTSNIALMAAFATDTFSIVTSQNIAEAGTTAGDGEYECGSIIAVTAKANSGYRFTRWVNNIGNIISLDSTFIINIKSDTNVTAIFEQTKAITDANTFEINISPNPTNDILNIDFRPHSVGFLNISLTNILGEEVMSIFNDFCNANFSKQISIKNLPRGIYYLKIQHNTTHIEKIIKD